MSLLRRKAPTTPPPVGALVRVKGYEGRFDGIWRVRSVSPGYEGHFDNDYEGWREGSPTLVWLAPPKGGPGGGGFPPESLEPVGP